MVYIARRGIPTIFGEARRDDYNVTTGEGHPTLPDFRNRGTVLARSLTQITASRFPAVLSARKRSAR